MTMAQINKTVNSFEKKWPKLLIPMDLIKWLLQGFTIQVMEILLISFLCGITICNWEHTDDVDLEHKKHSPDCKFLLMCRQV